MRLPDPLVPSEVNLRDFRSMPLDVARLCSSDMVALSTGDEFKAAMTLWCISWHQVPASSLPDNDRILARLTWTGDKWPSLKKMALHGFIKCSDFRLYHPVIAEMAKKAWGIPTGKQRVLDVSSTQWAEIRELVFQRDNYTCVYCGARERLACDHVHALSKGGKSVVDNLATSCQPCNSSKGAKTLQEWMGA